MGLFFELFRIRRYKPLQGRLVRRLTMAGVWTIFAVAAWKCTQMDFTWVSRWMTWFAGLNTQLAEAQAIPDIVEREIRAAEVSAQIAAFDVNFLSVFSFILAGTILLFGLWFGWRLINWVTFGDFLISVEGEMAKVSWPSKQELQSATIVVLILFFFLGGLLLLYDLALISIFNIIGI